ncbi:hypothetical protein D187_010229 [Cystobacter fuscus DSM 2262]|uniref:DUF4832 domain-containing protein n=1 Tax=Cystobacter fuscus (strain ATCC 25194 / DSM 2262 / NBRC 100088 / M29) TaxID=1242864 RepID=S9PB58_CYSF2|nr:DUF4832 domain-containing protein [Cystobacter fuscus]EPX61610.1 hypothetical protein D187_010229 [Cystobacter fuscus DSM 2262]
MRRSMLLLSGLLLTSSSAQAAISAVVVGNDTSSVQYQFQYSGTPAYRRAYIDVDRNPATGFAQQGIGADYLLENNSLYANVGGGWNWQFIKTVTYTDSAGTVKWTVARADIAETATPNDADVVFQIEAPLETSAKYTHVYSGGTSPNPGTTQYTASSATIANPERGFYHHINNCNETDFVASTLSAFRTNEKITQVICVFYLAEFKNSPISQAQLERFQRQANSVRAAGLKMIVRFAYTTSESGDDAPLSRVTAHLDQLAPYLSANSDVISVVQTGFVGAWGEWAYTQNFGNLGNVSQTDWNNRKAVVDKLLSVLPASRMVQLRTPKFKRTMYGTTALSAAQAYNGSANARIGHHNDCFLASADDFGTYTNTSVEYPYLSAETNYLAMGGETCALNPPRSDCSTALSEMALFHYSYLNVDYSIPVINSWTSGGCRPEIDRRLGYRFALVSATFPATATRGAAMSLDIQIKNEGWAAPYNPRSVELVLRNTSSGAVYRVPLSVDPRRWLAGTTTSIGPSVTIPTSVPAGSYALLLNLPDPASSLNTRPEYSIQLANQNVWEASTGFNNLNRTVTVQ